MQNLALYGNVDAGLEEERAKAFIDPIEVVVVDHTASAHNCVVYTD
jgi:hypothetical protein